MSETPAQMNDTHAATSRRKAQHDTTTSTTNTTTPTPNNWHTPGPASNDLRSDVVTTPTPSMLNSIAHTTLLDDVFLEDPTTHRLSHLITQLTHKPAALLVLSGTMGNQVALRTHLPSPPTSVLVDPRSHIMTWEAGAGSWISGAFFLTATPRNGRYMTLEDVKTNAVQSDDDDDVHRAGTSLICLENTLDGTVLPLAECRRISAWARARHPAVKLHLDGARLWEAVAAGAGKLEEYCECFDSVSLCFSKGLGAPIGSILVGDEAFVNRARHVRKGFGGGLRQAGVVSAPAIVAVEETFLRGKLETSHRRAREVAEVWSEAGGVLQKTRETVETNMVWVDLEAAGLSVEEWVRAAKECGLRVAGGRLVVHYQIGEEALERFRQLAQRVLGPRQRKDHKREINGSSNIPQLTSAEVDQDGRGVEAKRMKLNVE